MTSRSSLVVCPCHACVIGPFQFVTGIMAEQCASRQSIRDLLRSYRLVLWLLRLLLMKYTHGYSAVLVTKCHGEKTL